MDLTYTYQGGQRFDLSQDASRFICRTTRERLVEADFQPDQAVSAHSWTVWTTPDRRQTDLERARLIAPAYPAYKIAGTGCFFLVTDRVFLRFRRPTSDGEMHEFGEHFALDVIERLSPRDFLCRVPLGSDVVGVVRDLTEKNIETVELVDHDLNIRPHLREVAAATDPDTAQVQWHLFSDVPNNRLIRSCALLDCEGAWKANGYGDSDVVIGIVDCGCDLSDPNFGPDKFVDWAVLLDGSLSSRDDFAGENKEAVMNPARIHGTLCATLAAAGPNKTGGVGVAPGCRLLPVKWPDLSGSTSFPQSLFRKIIEYLRDKVDVVSNSWSRGPNAYWPPFVAESLEDAAVNGGRHGKGMVWVWAAGNQNCPIRHSGELSVPVRVAGENGTLRVIESSTEFHNSFAGLPGVLHVGAISSIGQRCHYSNYGTGLDLVAPSGNIHLYGRAAAVGVEVQAPIGKEGLHGCRGTSAATPLVAAVAALVRSANPKLTATEIASLLRRTADRDLDMTGYESCGRPTDPDPAWDVSPIPPFQSGEFVTGHADGPWSPWFGFGKVNARRAVEEALRVRGS